MRPVVLAWIAGLASPGAFGCGDVVTKSGTIVELAVTLPNATLAWPIAQQATATATFGDGAVQDVTAIATWSSSNPAVAAVTSGLVASVDEGNAIIEVAVGGQTASTAVRVVMPTLAVLSYNDTDAGDLAGIDFFRANATGNAGPLRSIRGPATTIGLHPYGMAVHGQELFVSCGDDIGAVSVFPVTGSGNIAPTRRIIGEKTTVSSAIAFSVSDTEIVTVGNDSVLVFPTDGAGDIAPKRKIAGATTQLKNVVSATVDGDEIYATDYDNKIIAVFPASATGDVAPSRTIDVSITQFAQPLTAQVFDNELYVVTTADSINVYPKAASGNTARIRTIQGLRTQLQYPYMVAEHGGMLFVADRDDKVLVFKATDNGNVQPQRVISGPATNIRSPVAVVVF